MFKNTGDNVKQSGYVNIIGNLAYVVDCTIPDIAYVVGLLCRFTSRPGLEHWNIIERIMRYLKKILNVRLHYQMCLLVLESYSDANLNYFLDDSKSTDGYIFNIAGGVVLSNPRNKLL